MGMPAIDETAQMSQSAATVRVEIKQGKKSEKLYAAIKRLFDIAASLLGFLVTLPITLPVAIIIKASDGGPVIHKRICLGRNGRTYIMYKFRTMVMDADNLERWLTPEQMEEYRAECKLEDDPRITKIGRFLRKASIDELPQLLSVLKGDMSLVGPRPVVDSERHHYTDAEFDLLLTAKPGITGYWQVNGRSDSTYESGKRQKLELYYVANRSLLLDIKILFMTIAVVLKGKGAK